MGTIQVTPGVSVYFYGNSRLFQDAHETGNEKQNSTKRGKLIYNDRKNIFQVLH